jgi:hypothetical protein
MRTDYVTRSNFSKGITNPPRTKKYFSPTKSGAGDD